MDKLVGPKVRITINKFLPTIFVDAMKQNPEVVFIIKSEYNRIEDHLMRGGRGFLSFSLKNLFIFIY